MRGHDARSGEWLSRIRNSKGSALATVLGLPHQDLTGGLPMELVEKQSVGEVAACRLMVRGRP